MKLVKNKQKQFFGKITDVSEWEDGWVELTAEEIRILKQAQAICSQADDLTRKAHHDPDCFNSFGEADGALLEIIRNQD